MTTVKRLLIAAAAAAVSTVAQADIVIDDFTVQIGSQTTLSGTSSMAPDPLFANANKVTVNAGGTAVASSVDGSSGCAHILGCTRDVYIKNDYVPDSTTQYPGSNAAVSLIVRNNPFTAAVNSVAGQGEMAFSVETGSIAQATLVYNGGGAGLNTSFAGLSGINFWVRSDGGNEGTKLVSVTMEDTDGDTLTYLFPGENTSLLPGALNSFAPVLLGFGEVPDGNGLFGWTLDPTGNGTFDMGSIFSLSSVVNLQGDTENLDFALKLVTVVPEPGSLALVGLALAGIGGLSSRRRHKR